MEIFISLSSDLKIKSDALMSAWNSDDDCRSLSFARVPSSEIDQFELDPAMINSILISVASGIASNIIYDLLKRLISKLSSNSEVEFVSKENQNKSVIILVTSKKNQDK